MSKSDSSSANCLPEISFSKIAPQHNLDGSVFNKKLQVRICIGLNDSSILFIHRKRSSFCQNFICQIRVREFHPIPIACNAMGQNVLQKNCS